MRGVALLCVLAVAKLAILAGRPVQLSVWTPIAYLWQDVLVALVYAALDAAIKRAWFGWTLYYAAVCYAAINVPIARVLSSPLTWPMFGATGAPLFDSIRHHATPMNFALVALVAVPGVLLPRMLRGFEPRTGIKLATAGLLILPFGPLASSRVDTTGFDRNAIIALGSSAFQRLSTRVADVELAEDWRVSLLAADSRGEDLSSWGGSAAGRNVVLVVLESAGAGYLRPYGAANDPMPNFTDLSRAAIVFENAYAVFPESIKALFSVICSRYPAMYTDAESYAQVATPSVAAVLKAAAYRTALFHSGRFMYLGMDAVIENRGFEVLEDAGAIGGNHESSFGIDEPSTVRRALAWVDSLDRDERFFLTYLPIAGHHPYYVPEPGPFAEGAESDRYLNALHYADASLGALLKGLRERGLDERTLFVIFGDHGQAFGQHEGNYGHSLFLYEENIRVPFLIVAPGLIKEGLRVGREISLIDAAPTILDLLGIPPPAGFQGRTALRGPAGPALFCTDYSLSLIGLRDGCWKFIHELDSGRSKLFDLCGGEAEVNDLSALHPDLAAAYRARLKRWAEAQRALILNHVD